MTVLLVALGAAVGAPLRYLIDRVVQARHDSLFPRGTFAVNVAGLFILGILIGCADAVPGRGDRVGGHRPVRGAPPTPLSGYETVRLLEERAHLYAGLNAIASIVAGLGAVYDGVVTAAALLTVARCGRRQALA